MKRISILEKAGAFAENKDVARDIRLQDILPELDKGSEVVLDFEGVDAATQSFVHALISDVMRKHGGSALDLMAFKSCNEEVRKIISIVADYMQEGMGPP
ncbi:MAG: STAS-like domain-containing protein [Elusimicrobia bacterium]|nr:STAS-like domain-containing protein [Elusimicrobiota bacterium]